MVQLLSHIQLFVTPWTAACQDSLSFTISQSLPKFMSTELVRPSNRLILCFPLLFLPSIFPSIKIRAGESAVHIRGPKYWNFSFNPSSESSGLISFRMDWSDFAVEETLSSLITQFESISSLVLSLLYGPTLSFSQSCSVMSESF